MSPRVVHLFNSSSVSGPERLVLPALTGLANPLTVVNLREDRIEPPGTPERLRDFSHSLNLPHETLPVRKRWDAAAMDGLRKLLERLRPDLVHAHDVKASVYLLRAMRGIGRKFPIVSTHHGVLGRPDWRTRMYEWAYRRMFLRSFDRVLSVSTADHDVLMRSGIGRERVRLHLNGADGRRVEEGDRERLAAGIHGLWSVCPPGKGRPILLGVVGRLSAEKDHDRLFRVLSSLERLGHARDWKCLIFGAGPLEMDLRRRVTELGLDHRVRWMGYRKGVGAELAGLDLLLSFSKAEGLPVNLIEAGWAGTPAMATQVGGVTDLIPDETFGNRVHPREAPRETALRLRTLISEEGAARLRGQGRRFQERVAGSFSRCRWLARLAEVYSELGVRVSLLRPKPPHGIRKEALNAVAV